MEAGIKSCVFVINHRKKIFQIFTNQNVFKKSHQNGKGKGITKPTQYKNSNDKIKEESKDLSLFHFTQQNYKNHEIGIVCKAINNPRFDCFMISAFQCLLCIPEFSSSFNEKQDMKAGNLKNNTNCRGEVCKALKHLVSSYFDVSSSPIDLCQIRECFEEEFPSSHQHDSLQFILDLFEAIKKEENPSKLEVKSNHYQNYKNAWEEYTKNNFSIVDKLFFGMYETKYDCTSCRKKLKVYEEFNHVPLICDRENPKIGFDEFLNLEYQSSQRTFKCKHCSKTCPCTITKRIIKYPKYLIMAFQRLNLTTMTKINTPMPYKPSFTLKTPSKVPITYNLHSFISHTGALHSGHYTATRKHTSGWLHFNDHKFRPVKFAPGSKIVKNMYILFYKTESNCDI
ncbi:unnamed protein product [Moneuplotes crassus]|uniref:USP domain-containing protein n=1 Tax=Euplotes crassus TaxID=5936 RepID=A0AAD1XGS2_EUPCR|nr:unnamed protein product [Moneuplotes crassus]